jgi:hypothetical protein
MGDQRRGAARAQQSTELTEQGTRTNDERRQSIPPQD